MSDSLSPAEIKRAVTGFSARPVARVDTVPAFGLLYGQHPGVEGVEGEIVPGVLLQRFSPGRHASARKKYLCGR